METAILTNTGRLGELDKEMIKNSILTETTTPRSTAEYIAERAFNGIGKITTHKNTNLIREVVLMKMLEEGLTKHYHEYSRLGMPVSDLKQLIYNYDNENANVLFNAQSINKQLSDSVSKQYVLFHVLPKQLSKAHLNGEIHIHDLDYFLTAPFCFSHDMRFFLKNGIQPDGLNGKFGAVSGPAKSLNVAMQHAARVMLTSSAYFSGGQGFDSLNLHLAPYAKGLGYDEVKQAVEGFVYDMDQIFIRPGQTAFSSTSLELNVPKYLDDVPIVKPGGVTDNNESYSDYIDEARQIASAFTEVFDKGDYLGKPFHFPKPEYKIRRETLKDSSTDQLMYDIHKLVAKNGTPYFLNMAAPYMPDALQSQCCRYFLAPDGDFWEEIKEGTVRSGSIQTVTLNLPNIAYHAGKDEQKVMELIDKRVDMLEELFNQKRYFMKKIMDSGNAPWLTMNCNKKPYFKIEASTNSVGFIGLNEMVKFISGEELHESKDAWGLGLRIISHMSKKVESKNTQTGQRWGLVQTPAEGAAYRLPKQDIKNFPKTAVFQGTKDCPYYTNSNHSNYSADIPLFERMKIDSSFHPVVKGGVISHVFLGESTPDPEALTKLTRKICSQTLTAYYAYTKDMSTCSQCNQTFGGVLNLCPNCGAQEDSIQWYSRVTGYYTPVKSWNEAKYNEFINRKKYNMRR